MSFVGDARSESVGSGGGCARHNSVAGGDFKKESGAGAQRGRGEVALKVRQEAMGSAGGMNSSVAETVRVVGKQSRGGACGEVVV